MLIEATEDFTEVFAYKNTVEYPKFSKAIILESLDDLIGDLRILVNRSVAMQKVENKNLLVDRSKTA
jgi:hypothetical protein